MNLFAAIEIFGGGPGSGCNPDVAQPRCGRPEGDGSSSSGKSGMESFTALKQRWATVNNDLLNYIDKPDSPEAKKGLDELRDITKQIHKLDIDKGGSEGIGLPGGARDIAIVGAGPGGLSTAIMGATDGLDTVFIDSQEKVGGQAKYSSRIENLPGFPIGVSGMKLTGDMYDQAVRLGAEDKLGVRVTGLAYDPETGLKTLTLSNGDKVQARSVVLAGGMEFRKVNFPGSDSPSVIYGNGDMLMRMGTGKPVVVVGGSNGAAQAALGSARTASQVYLLSRSSIDKDMSDYQVQAVRNHPKITVIENDEIAQLFTDDHGNATNLSTKGGRNIKANYVGVFAGGATNTGWLPTEVKTQNGKIVVNGDLETGIPGVFAIGDNRVGGLGRVGAAIGDGQMAERNVFQYFKKRNSFKSSAALNAADDDKKNLDAWWDKIIDRAFDLDEQS